MEANRTVFGLMTERRRKCFNAPAKPTIPSNVDNESALVINASGFEPSVAKAIK